MTRIHKLFLLFLLLVKPVQAQTADPLLTEARAGDTITLTVHNSEPADTLQVYRKTSVTATPSLVGSIPVIPDTWEYTWKYIMPGGTTAQYRFFVVCKKNGILEGESNVARVKRIK